MSETESDIEILNIKNDYKHKRNIKKEKHKRKIKNNENPKNGIKIHKLIRKTASKKRIYRRSKPTKRITSRIEKCLQQINSMKIISKHTDVNETAIFNVQGLTNTYDVTISEHPKCTCPDWNYNKDVCKHLIYVYIVHFGLLKSNKIIWQRRLVKQELQCLNIIKK